MANQDGYDHLRESSDDSAQESHAGPFMDPVINEIVDEVDSGNAHLMTRNELAEFVEWLVTDENATIDDPEAQDTIEINSVVNDFMNYGEFRSFSRGFATEVAKRFFVHKGYER